MKRRVVVTGAGIVCAAGNDSSSAWDQLVGGRGFVQAAPLQIGAGVSASGRVTRFDGALALDQKSLRRSPLFVHYAAAAATQAWRDAAAGGVPPDAGRTGVSIGTAHGSTLSYLDEHPDIGPSIERGVVPRKLALYPTAGLSNLASGMVSLQLGLTGPILSSASGMLAGLHSIVDGYWCIRSGEADAMICGATETPLSAFGFAAYKAAGWLSSSDYAPWSDMSDGFHLGEGATALILEEREHALRSGKTIYAELAGYGFKSCGSRHPCAVQWADARWAALRQALSGAGLRAGDLGAIHLDAWALAGSDMADRALCERLRREGADPQALTIKPALGHALGAASAMEAWSAVMALHSGLTPAPFHPANAPAWRDMRRRPNAAKPASIAVVASAMEGSVGAILLKHHD